MTARPPLRMSVVIPTYNRASSLSLTLDALTRVDPNPFEVIVVEGPSTDDTAAMLDEWGDRIKRVACPTKNLSSSRNLGIAAAAGELVAFIDDDAYPDPAWLRGLAAAFEDPEVAGAGGPTLDHSGSRFQAFYNFANRVGEAWVAEDKRGPNPTALLNRPGTRMFVYPIGTNAAFRRDCLIAIGGFDEEYDYYLDETDVAIRLIDRGYVIAAVDDAVVHHKFLRSDIRTEERALRCRFSVLKNRTYFALRHGLGQFTFAEVTHSLSEFHDHNRADIESNVAHGLLTKEDVARFEADIHDASEVGFAMWREGPKLRDSSWFAAGNSPFLPFPVLKPEESRLHLCFLTQEHPPGAVNGIGRLISTLARALAGQGHLVRVITDGGEEDSVDLEDGVWVHRLAARDHLPPDDVDLPAHIWSRSMTALDALHEIDELRSIDLVHCPNWDVEGVAVIRAGAWPVAVGLYTPIATARRMDPELIRDPWIDSLIAADRWCYEHADLLIASDHAVVEEIERAYEIALDQRKICHVKYGLYDEAADSRTTQDSGDGEIRVVFVGRLEYRKGIDAVLEAGEALLRLDTRVSLTIIGDDRISAPGGGTYRDRFESAAGPSIVNRVRFTGRISDEERRSLLDAADIVLAPSRFESFGLVALEAMMRGKAFVAGNTPAMRGIVEGGAGLVVDADDPSSLVDAVAALIRSASLRVTLGEAARLRFLEQYQASTMGERYVEIVRSKLRT